MTAKPLQINIAFTDRAARLLGGASSPLSFPSPEISQQPVARGDRIRIDGIANCPWLVVSERFWSLGEASTTLTIWLDESED